MRAVRLASMAVLVLMSAMAWVAPGPAEAVEQGSITVQKTWPGGEVPHEVLPVCFKVTADAEGREVVGQGCVADESSTVVFGPADPALQTGVTYYVWELVGDGPEVRDNSPQAVVIPDTSGAVTVVFESPRALHPAGTVEIHKRVCPNGPPTTDIFAECHGTPPGQPVAFAVDGGAPVEADAAGNLVFADLGPGEHTVTETEGPPLAYVALRVYCTDIGMGGEVEEIATDGPNFSVAVESGSRIVCDVYNIPLDLSGGTASIEVHQSACPPGASGDLFGQCHANGLGGVEFLVDGPQTARAATAGPIGAVRFDGLPGGTYTIAEMVPSGDYAQYVVYCSDGAGTEVPFAYRGNGRAAVMLDVADGQHVVCDWFNIPAAHAIPAPEGEIASGGIGLSRAAWEDVHGRGVRSGQVLTYEGGAYQVAFAQRMVVSIETGWEREGGIGASAATAAVRDLLPADATLVETFTLPATPEGPIALSAERYASADLGDRLAHLAVPRTGSVLVVYQLAQESDGEEPVVTRVSLAVGIDAMPDGAGEETIVPVG